MNTKSWLHKEKKRVKSQVKTEHHIIRQWLNFEFFYALFLGVFWVRLAWKIKLSMGQSWENWAWNMRFSPIYHVIYGEVALLLNRSTEYLFELSWRSSSIIYISPLDDMWKTAKKCTFHTQFFRDWHNQSSILRVRLNW